MIKIYLLTFTFLFNWAFSQVVFCPPGAEWHYLFNTNNLNPKPHYENETVKYTGDSIIGQDTIKILSHHRFFWRYNNTFTGYTLIKQKGDTVFMKNKHTQYSWQILYNFAAQPGQGWSTIINNPTPKTYSFTVTSVTDTILKGQPIKILDYSGSGIISSKIYERFGAGGFLFPFIKGSSTDGDYLMMSLCYKDDIFGVDQYTDYPCNYSNAVGLNEYDKNRNAELYPNPFNSELSFKNFTEGEIRVFSSDGKEVLSVMIDNENRSQIINTEKLSPGFYYVKFPSHNSIITKKLVKE